MPDQAEKPFLMTEKNSQCNFLFMKFKIVFKKHLLDAKLYFRYIATQIWVTKIKLFTMNLSKSHMKI